jgi:penicillin-binding protein 1C
MMRRQRCAKGRLAMNEQRPHIWRATRAALCCMLAATLVLAVATRLSLRDFPDSLDTLTGAAVKSQVLARDGTRLSYTLENAWNTTDAVPLAAVPPLLQTAFIVAEDQHFYEHHGVDWPARCAALARRSRWCRNPRREFHH